MPGDQVAVVLEWKRLAEVYASCASVDQWCETLAQS